MRRLSFLFLIGALLLGGCLTPISQAPRVVTLPHDVKFEATPPIGFPTREYSITKGRYTFWKQDMAAFYYVCDGAMVSWSKPGVVPEIVLGGLGIDRSNGRFFIWKRDVSVDSMAVMGPVTIFGQGGRDIQPFIAGIPKEMSGEFQIER